MTPKELNEFRIIPRLLIVAMTLMTYRSVEWFMTIPPDQMNPEAAALVSVMTGALTGAFGLFLNSETRD
jgi:hypothetical protein